MFEFFVCCFYWCGNPDSPCQDSSLLKEHIHYALVSAFPVTAEIREGMFFFSLHPLCSAGQGAAIVKF